MYQVYFGTVVHLVPGGTCIFGSLSLLQKRFLQKLNADKTSGELPTADIDLICVFKVIVTLILFEKGAKTLLRKAAHGIIITPQLVNSVQVFGADFVICLETDIPLGA